MTSAFITENYRTQNDIVGVTTKWKTLRQEHGVYNKTLYNTCKTYLRLPGKNERYARQRHRSKYHNHESIGQEVIAEM